MKKKMFLIFVLSLALLYVPSVFAENIKGCADVMPNAMIDIKIANTVHTVILLIQIAVPVILVIFGMLDLLKAITGAKEDEIKKGQQMLIKRIITAVIVFFVIAIVKAVVSLAASPEEGTNIMTCANCFLNGAKNRWNL